MAIDLAQERASLDWYEDRRDEFLAALSAASGNRDWEQVIERATTLAPFLERRSYWQEGERVTTWGVDAARRIEDPAAEALLLEALGTRHRLQSRWREASEEFERALAIFTELEDTPGRARALNALGLTQRK